MSDHSNLAVEHIVALLQAKFNDVKKITDKGLIANVTLSQPYEDHLKVIDKQYTRMAKGLMLLDKVTTKVEFKELADIFPEVVDELYEAFKAFMQDYTDAVYKRVKKDLD